MAVACWIRPTIDVLRTPPLPLALTPSSRLSRIGRHSCRPTPPPCSKNSSSVIRRSTAPRRCLRARRYIVSCLREGSYLVGSLRYIVTRSRNSTMAPSSKRVVISSRVSRGDLSRRYFIHIAQEQSKWPWPVSAARSDIRRCLDLRYL